MREDPEPGDPAREQAGDSVRDEDIELCQPAFAKAHQQNSRCGYGDDQDRSCAHDFADPSNEIERPDSGHLSRTIMSSVDPIQSCRTHFGL